MGAAACQMSKTSRVASCQYPCTIVPALPLEARNVDRVAVAGADDLLVEGFRMFRLRILRSAADLLAIAFGADYLAGSAPASSESSRTDWRRAGAQLAEGDGDIHRTEDRGEKHGFEVLNISPPGSRRGNKRHNAAFFPAA